MNPSEEAGCAGFVVLCKNTHCVLLVSTHNGNWGFPKGKRNPNPMPKTGREGHEECAWRELEEETGLVKSDVATFNMETTFFLERTDKGNVAVKLFLATTETCIEPKVSDTDELAIARWIPYEEALTLLTLKNRRQILEDAIRTVCATGD